MFGNNRGKCLVSAIAEKYSQAIFLKETEQKIIALTIDDLPARDEDSKESTRQILEAIDSHNSLYSTTVSATFFITTDHLKFASNPNKIDSDILAEIVEKGHEIGNHGQVDQLHFRLSEEDFKTEFLEAHRILSQYIEQSIKWFRPGRVLYHKSMLKTLAEVAQKLPYCKRFALASMIPLDTLSLFESPDFTLKNIEHFTFPGSILILHGGLSGQALRAVEVLNKLLPKLYQEGYQVVSLSKLFDL